MNSNPENEAGQTGDLAASAKRIKVADSVASSLHSGKVLLCGIFPQVDDGYDQLTNGGLRLRAIASKCFHCGTRILTHPWCCDGVALPRRIWFCKCTLCFNIDQTPDPSQEAWAAFAQIAAEKFIATFVPREVFYGIN
jgi:hypothetical protein